MKTTQILTISNNDLDMANELINKTFSAEIKAGSVIKINDNSWKEVTHGGLFGYVLAVLECAYMTPLEVNTIKEGE